MSVQRYQCKISYDGTNFSGYQIQPNGRTVQSVLEMSLAKLHKGVEVKVTASGRTDAGVHAKGQVIHFDSPLQIPQEKWQVAMNSLLPEDVSVLQVNPVKPDFHARFDAVAKEYRYYIQVSSTRDPFLRHYAYRYPNALHYGEMEKACRLLEGTHDFTSFCSAKTEVVDRIRTIKLIEFTEINGLLEFRFVGTGFLYNMVRILMGTLLEVGNGERVAESIPELIKKQDRTLAGKTAPGHGLYLWEVFY